MLKLPIKIVTLILFSMLVFANPLCVSASIMLEAKSSSVSVLELPVPQISDVDAANGIIVLKSELDTDINADLRAIVSVLDENGNILETSEVKVVDAADIRVSLKTKLQKGYHLDAKFINHDIQSAEIGSTTQLSEDAVKPIPNTGPVTVPSGSHGTTIEYVVTEATPIEVIVEKIVAVEKPIEFGNESSNVNVNSGSQASDSDESSDTIIALPPSSQTNSHEQSDTDSRLYNSSNTNNDPPSVPNQLSAISVALIIPLLLIVVALLMRCLWLSKKLKNK